MEVGELVALQRPISQADRVRDDLEPRQEASHAVRGDRLASFPFRPRAALDGDQHLDQFGRWQPVRPALREDGADIGKQSDAGGLIIVTGGHGDALNSPASAPRPFAADGIGDGEQRAPVISGAVRLRRPECPGPHRERDPRCPVPTAPLAARAGRDGRCGRIGTP